MDLPAEIWSNIFDLAADEDVIFQYGLPTMMSESAWSKNIFGKWVLRRPSEAMNLVQTRSYATKKAIISTCKSWYRIASELLFRCVFFREPHNLIYLCEALRSKSSEATTISSSLGWWTRRIHVCRSNRSTTMANLDEALISIIEHCPNLEVFFIDVPMGKTFGPVTDALVTHALKSLRTVHWNVSCELLPKVILALDCLPSIICAHVDFESPPSSSSSSFGDEDFESGVPLGSASGLCISLLHLQQLSLRGFFGQFLEEASGWSMPALRCVSFDCGNHRTDQPDAVGFLSVHGSELTFLDLNCIPALDVPQILDLCPKLQTFCFNADWRLEVLDNNYEGVSSSTRSRTVSMAQHVPFVSKLVNGPHWNITTIGLHGLMYAFGVGYAAAFAANDPIRSEMIRRSNDLNVAALMRRGDFPQLRCVRMLSKAMLTELNEANGPSDEGGDGAGGGGGGGVERYDRWWDGLTRVGVRLEDCTGALLGTLPMDEVEGEVGVGGEGEGLVEEEGEEEEEEEEYEDYEEEEETSEDDDERDRRESLWKSTIQPEALGSQVEELRQLLAECRAMEETREPSVFAPIFPAVQYSMIKH